jgi:hypothetical protein
MKSLQKPLQKYLAFGFSFLSITQITIGLTQNIASAKENVNLSQEVENVKNLCKTLKGEDNLLCQIAGLHIGSNRMSTLGQNTTSASPKVVANLGNVCKRLVPEFLVSPGSAKFPAAPNTKELFVGMYVIRGKVDSQNLYGALLRSNYFCYLRHVPNRGVEIVGVKVMK